VADAGDRRRVDAHLVTDELSVPEMLRPLLDQRLAAAAAAEAVVAGQQSPWPDEPFDGGVLDAYDGSISLAAKRLMVAEGMSLANAAVDVALARGKVEVSKIESDCLGGRCGATLRFDKVPAGVELSGQVTLTGASLASVAPGTGDKPGATGTVSGQIKFSGKGTSPRSALSVLQGSGKLEFADGKLAAVWPGAIAAGAEAALKAEPDKLAAVLREALTAGLTAGELPLPGSVALEIADGQLTVKPFAIDTAEGRADGAASLDLRSLAFESEWHLNQKSPAPGEKPALPPVTLLYRGPAASLGSMEPRISTDALERELAVRRMERDVEELERLRKLDEARRREEAERQRRQFEQSPEPAPAPVPVAPVEPQPRAAAPG
jgi:AsmA-like protein